MKSMMEASSAVTVAPMAGRRSPSIRPAPAGPGRSVYSADEHPPAVAIHPAPSRAVPAGLSRHALDLRAVEELADRHGGAPLPGRHERGAAARRAGIPALQCLLYPQVAAGG